tara:strand:+ start:172 stop:456 length:285 start_codon:yes stop_codon:yes gene_type:complete
LPAPGATVDAAAGRLVLAVLSDFYLVARLRRPRTSARKGVVPALLPLSMSTAKHPFLLSPKIEQGVEESVQPGNPMIAAERGTSEMHRARDSPE